MVGVVGVGVGVGVAVGEGKSVGVCDDNGVNGAEVATTV